ncbi:hypothetical protein T4B_6527 [Trichinella pseudospiralis]|uniref:FLYWCH-type domain-containing protein n=1 Tax=Trichinella pseudospiralis TaxID=6337 RepID=A0A0V1I325_TRIPS|nr:hypothetical protein T4B_6527 [Trichinella pseudospiralis]
MADNLHLVSNERGNYNLVREGRAYNLKRTNMEDKHWVCRQVKKGCWSSMHTNLKVDTSNYSSNIPLIRSASADLETASQFPTYKSVEMAMYRKRAQKFPRLPPTRQQLEIPPQWEMTKSGRRFVLYISWVLHKRLLLPFLPSSSTEVRLLVFITVVGATRLRPDCQTKLTPRVSYEKGYSPLRSRTNDSVSLLET